MKHIILSIALLASVSCATAPKAELKPTKPKPTIEGKDVAGAVVCGLIARAIFL